MQTYSRHLKDGTVVIESHLDEVMGFTAGVMLEYNKALAGQTKELELRIIEEIRKVILRGGDNRGAWGWSYWQRKRGKRNFELKQGTAGVSFSTGWKTTGDVTNYPVHPRTYFMKRKKKKVPKADQFALYDTGRYLRSFMLRSSISVGDVNMDLITSNKKHFDNMENGVTTKFGVVKRPHVAPAMYRLNASNRGGASVMQKAGNKLATELRKKASKARMG